MRCSSSHFFPTVPRTHDGVPDGKVPSPGIDDVGSVGDFPSLCCPWPKFGGNFPVTPNGTSRDIRLRGFKTLSLPNLVFGVSTAVRFSIMGVHVGEGETSSKIRVLSFFLDNSSSSGDSEKSSSTSDEFADVWENRVLPLLLVVTDDVD